MTKRFKHYRECTKYLLNLRLRIQEILKNSPMATWTNQEISLIDVALSCMEEKAHEYVFVDSASEYKAIVFGYFGNEPVIEGELVAMTYAYENIDDYEANKRDIIILVEDI